MNDDKTNKRLEVLTSLVQVCGARNVAPIANEVELTAFARFHPLSSSDIVDRLVWLPSLFNMTLYLPLEPESPFPSSPSFLVPAQDPKDQLHRVIKAIMKAKRIVVVCGTVSHFHIAELFP